MKKVKFYQPHEIWTVKHRAKLHPEVTMDSQLFLQILEDYEEKYRRETREDCKYDAEVDAMAERETDESREIDRAVMDSYR